MDIKWSQNYCEIAKKPPVLNGRFEIASSISFDSKGQVGGAKGCGFKHPPAEQKPKTTISKIMTMLAVVKTETQLR